MFLDLAMTHCRCNLEFAARDFGLLRIEGHAVRCAPSHHLGDGIRCHGNSLVYCVAYGQDGRVICIAEATLGVS
jgi:hypothetical protein